MAPELVKALFARIRAFYCGYAERIPEAADGQLDIWRMGDDLGTQPGPMTFAAMWVEFLGPGFAEFVALAKSYGLWVMHHTCGSVRPLIPLIIKRGLDVLQSSQPQAADMDPWELKATFGEGPAFHGGISFQRTLPFGTHEEIRREVQDRVAALAPGGGYIVCTSHNAQADTQVRNVEALVEAYHDYGKPKARR
ncbi:MAG: hypothetical protein JXA74_16905 [Anaerolineae bacterium]|nr:hypothetical protein [Anaerolineae bacterium]